jgi:hypothetical protein
MERLDGIAKFEDGKMRKLSEDMEKCRGPEGQD